MRAIKPDAWGIVEGRKTVVFEVKRPKTIKAGGTYPLQVVEGKGKRPSSPIGTVRIVAIDQLRLGELTDQDYIDGGYRDFAHFKERWLHRKREWDLRRPVWRVRVELIATERTMAAA